MNITTEYNELIHILHVPKQLSSSKVGNKLKQYINSQLREICRKETKSFHLSLNKCVHIYLTNVKDFIKN